MTQSVTDQTPIPTVTWRQHNDPPGLWIAVVIGSVTLHLLVFWLMRSSSNAFSPWFPRGSQAAVPIEFVDISPTATSKAKPKFKARTVSRPSANQQSSAARLPEQSQLTPRNQNYGGINFGASSRQQRKSKTFASKPNTKVVPKRSVREPTPTPTPTFTPTPPAPPTPRPIDSPANLPWNRQRDEIRLGKPTPLPSFTPVEPRQPTVSDSVQGRNPKPPVEEDSPVATGRRNQPPVEEDSPVPTRRRNQPPVEEDSPVPSRRRNQPPVEEDSPVPTRRRNQPPVEESPSSTQKTPQPPTGGGLIAISRFVTPEEQRSLMRNPPPEDLILPEHIGSNEKQINLLSLKPNLDLPEGEFLASLVIDKAGNFVQAEVIDPAIAPGERDKYKKFADQVFQGEKFQPARSTNGTPLPDLINRFVRIEIQRR